MVDRERLLDELDAGLGPGELDPRAGRDERQRAVGVETEADRGRCRGQDGAGGLDGGRRINLELECCPALGGERGGGIGTGAGLEQSGAGPRAIEARDCLPMVDHRERRDQAGQGAGARRGPELGDVSLAGSEHLEGALGRLGGEAGPRGDLPVADRAVGLGGAQQHAVHRLDHPGPCPERCPEAPSNGAEIEAVLAHG